MSSVIFTYSSTLEALNATIVVFNPFYQPIRSLSLRTKCVFEHKDLQMLDLKLEIASKFHPLEVVGRGSETQLQVGENFR